MIPERRGEKEESDSVLRMGKKAGDDKVLGVGEGLLESESSQLPCSRREGAGPGARP